MSKPTRAAAITYLPFVSSRTRRPSDRRDSDTTVAAAASPASHSHSLAARVTQVRAWRVDRFFRKRAEQRELAAAHKPSVAALVAHKVSRLMSLFAKSNRPALKAKLRAFFSRDTLQRSVRGWLDAIRKCVKRFRGPTAAELLHLALLRQQNAAKRRTFLQLLVRALAAQGRKLLRAKRTQQVRDERTHTFAVTFVHQSLLSANQLARIVQLERARREEAAQRRMAVVIQRTWRKWTRTQRTRVEAKRRLLDLLALVTPALQREDERTQQRQRALEHMCEQTHAQVIHSAQRRLAARLVQRVWRGYCARVRVSQLCVWRHTKAQQRRQHARLQKARQALLEPSTYEQARQRAVDLRAQARKQRTPLVLPPTGGTHHLRRLELTHARASLLEPLPRTNPPPRVSTLTHAKTQRVPFATFDKICTQHARVNPQNLWVAIPVGFVDTDTGAVTATPRKKRPGRARNRFFAAQYDWVPATLLQEHPGPF